MKFSFFRNQNNFGNKDNKVRRTPVGGPERFGNSLMPVRLGWPKIVLGKMVQRPTRDFPVHAMDIS